MKQHQPILILAGAYGVGKSEVALNLALSERRAGKPVTLGDLDVVNLYFRSRQRHQLLEDAGIQVISSSLGHINTQDLPAVSNALRGPLRDKERLVIIDAGGDRAGLRPLELFRDDFGDRAELLVVLNHLRPENRDVSSALQTISRIEAQSRLKLAGLVVNSHLLGETTVDHLLDGLAIAREVSRLQAAPLRRICGSRKVLGDLPKEIDIPRLTINHYLRSDWMG